MNFYSSIDKFQRYQENAALLNQVEALKNELEAEKRKCHSQ